MRVWLTRTEPGATRQATALAAHGFGVLKAPVLAIEPLQTTPPEGSFDVVVFVSEHAVSCAAANGWLCGPAMPIGTAAVRALQARGVVPSWPAQANSQGVVDVLAASPPGRVLVVKGVGGQTTLQDWLRSRERTVVEWDVYRRVPLDPVISGERVDAIVVSSGDGLRVVEQLWSAERREARIPLLVPSKRVADLAWAMGFERVVVTAGAGSAAVVDALLELREGSGNG